MWDIKNIGFFDQKFISIYIEDNNLLHNDVKSNIIRFKINLDEMKKDEFEIGLSKKIIYFESKDIIPDEKELFYLWKIIK